MSPSLTCIGRIRALWPTHWILTILICKWAIKTSSYLFSLIKRGPDNTFIMARLEYIQVRIYLSSWSTTLWWNVGLSARNFNCMVLGQLTPSWRVHLKLRKDAIHISCYFAQIRMYNSIFSNSHCLWRSVHEAPFDQDVPLGLNEQWMDKSGLTQASVQTTSKSIPKKHGSGYIKMMMV